MKKSIPLKEIVGFLSYGLKCKSLNGMSDGEDLLIGIYGQDNVTLCARVNNHNTVDYGCSLSEIKPIVRPLSDLTKEITHNGETFVPIVELSGYKDIKGDLFFGYEHKLFYVKIRPELTNEWVCHTIPSDLLSMDYFTVQKLHQWHFDIYDWIKDGLAIDINTL